MNIHFTSYFKMITRATDAKKARLTFQHRLTSTFQASKWAILSHQTAWASMWHTHGGPMVLLYMVCHGSHQYTPFLLALYTSTMVPMGNNVVKPKKTKYIETIRKSSHHSQGRRNWWSPQASLPTWASRDRNMEIFQQKRRISPTELGL